MSIIQCLLPFSERMLFGRVCLYICVWECLMYSQNDWMFKHWLFYFFLFLLFSGCTFAFLHNKFYKTDSTRITIKWNSICTRRLMRVSYVILLLLLMWWLWSKYIIYCSSGMHVRFGCQIFTLENCLSSSFSRTLFIFALNVPRVHYFLFDGRF